MDKQIRTDIGGNAMKIYHTETQADYDALMVELEEQGATWNGGEKLTEINNWPEFKRQTGIKLQDCILTYCDVEYFERVYPETPIIKYTTKKEMQLPEWANWVARDKDGELWCFKTKPYKEGDVWNSEDSIGRFEIVDDVGEIYNLIQWDDKEPTEVIWGTGLGMSTLDKYKSIMNAKAHGYDEVPEVTDKDGVETTSISFEEAMALVENKVEVETETNKDMVNQPNHYIGEYGLEVEDVLRNFIPRYTDPYVGHRIASAIEYLLRSPLKNQRQDIEKAGKNIQQALAYLDMVDEENE